MNFPPFETEDLRENRARFLDTAFVQAEGIPPLPVGNYRWGVYAFFDYDGEPIYVGQTNERLRTRRSCPWTWCSWAVAEPLA